MGDNITDASYLLQFKPDDQITGYLKEIAQEAAKGITLEIDSDVSDVLKDIDKIAKALNDTMAQSGTFDFGKLFDLKTSLAKLGELSKTVGGVKEIFSSLNGTTDALAKSMTHIASLKLDAGQFSSIKDSLDKIDGTLSSISDKLAGIDDASGLKETKKQADAVGESLEKAARKQEELNNAQANQPAKKKTVKDFSDEEIDKRISALEREKNRRKELASTVHQTKKLTEKDIEDITKQINKEQQAIEEASKRLVEFQGRLDKINTNKTLSNIYGENVKNLNYGVDTSKITKVEATIKTITSEIEAAKAELNSTVDLYAKQGIQDNINYLERMKLDLQAIVDGNKGKGTYDKAAYDAEKQRLHALHEESERFYAGEIKQAQGAIKYNEDLITQKKELVKTLTNSINTAQQTQGQKEVAKAATEAGQAQVNAQEKAQAEAKETELTYESIKAKLEELYAIGNKMQKHTLSSEDFMYSSARPPENWISVQEDDFNNLDKLKAKTLELYKLYKNVESAVKNNAGMYKGAQYGERDLREMSMTIGDMMTSYVNMGGKIEDVTAKMTKPFKQMGQEVVENVAHVNAIDAAYEQEAQAIRAANAQLEEQYRLIADSIALLGKGIPAGKLWGEPVTKQDRVSLELPNSWHFEYDDVANQERVLNNICKILGVDLPNAQKQATAAAQQAGEAQVNTQNGAQQEAQETLASVEQIEQAYQRLKAIQDSWSHNDINRTLTGNYNGVGEGTSTRTVISQLKNAHESYDLSIANSWNWEDQYSWAVKFVGIYEEYASRADHTNKSLSKHTELYEQLKPKVEAYRNSLQAVLDLEQRALNGTQQTTSSTPAQPMQGTADQAAAAAANTEALERQLAEATARAEALEQQMAEVNARAQQTVTGKVDVGNTVAVTSDSGQLALEKTLKATYHIQQNMVKIMAEINAKMVSGAETATISYEQLSAAVTSVVTAMEKLSTTTFAPTGVIDATNDRIVELEANLTKATQRIKELESNSSKASSKSVASTTSAVVQKTQEQLDLENKVAEVTKFSTEARIRIQKNLQKQILETTALISTEYDKIREMYQYINDFAYQSNGKKNAFNNAMNAKKNLLDFNKSGSTDTVQRAELEYAYQKSYEELLNKIGKSQSNSNHRMLSQLGTVKTSASLEENLAIIEREIAATSKLIDQQRALNAARQGRIDSHGSALEELHNINILAKQYDNYIAKQKTVDKLKQKIATATESGASEQQLISLNKQLDYANEKLQKADAFMQKAFANNPVGEAIVKMRALADETERVSKASSSTKTTTTADTTKDPLKEYQAAHKKIFGSVSLGRLIDPQNNQELVTLLNQVQKLDRLINTTGGDIKNINDATQIELKETAEQLARLQNTANGEAIKKGALKAYNTGRGDYAGAFKALSEEQGLMFKNAQVGSAQYTAALTSAAQSIAGFKLETAELDSSQKKLVATYRDQQQNLQQLTVSYQELGNGARYVQKMVEPHKSFVKDALNPIAKKMKELMTYFSSFMVLMRVINFVKEGVNTIRELNTAFTELKVVTGESNDAVEKFEKSAQKVARSIASTTLEVTQSATEWSKLGYTMAESLELAEQAAMYSKVGFTDIGVATENLTATLQAFYSDDIKKGIISAGDAAAEITDKLVFVGNKFASSAEGMGSGITAAGAALVAANNSLDESLAMITAGIVCLNCMETYYYRTRQIALSA